MRTLWKENWEETRQHFQAFWKHEGFVVAYAPRIVGKDMHLTHHADVPDPGQPATPEEKHANPEFRARYERYRLSRQYMGADTLPVALTDIGPGSLAMYVGSEPEFSMRTVWYHPSITDPENHPPLVFDPQSPWCRRQEEMARLCLEHAHDNYFVGLPDLIEHFDILASLRGNEELLMDLYVRPDWVKCKLAELNQVYFQAYDRVYDLVKLQDGSSIYGTFHMWGPGKVAKLQCDAAAMLSPDHFREFVVPYLTEQCEYLDSSLFHLDGTNCICHLDALLEIDRLGVIQWTVQTREDLPRGGDPHWFDMYRRILEAGKGVFAIQVRPDQVKGMLDALGTRGLYMLVHCESIEQCEEVNKTIEPYRRGW